MYNFYDVIIDESLFENTRIFIRKIFEDFKYPYNMDNLWL